MIAQLPKTHQAVTRLLLWLTVGSGGVVCGETRDPVELYLPKEAVINRPLVTVADVAQLKGGTPELRALIGAIDLAELTQDASSETIRASQLELRLKLAGIDSARFRLSGAPSTRITRRREPLRDETIIQAVRGPLAAHWKVDPSAVQLRLARPLSEAIRSSLEASEALDFQPFILESCRPGRLPLNVGAYRNGQLVQTFPLTVDVELKRRVLVARQDLRPGQTITEQDVQAEQRALTGRTALEVADDVVGHTAARWVRTGAVLERADIRLGQRTTREDARPYTVPRRSVVRLVARKPGLRVTVSAAELLEDGRIGETVSARNLTSNRIVTGRLVDPSEVEVSF